MTRTLLIPAAALALALPACAAPAPAPTAAEPVDLVAETQVLDELGADRAGKPGKARRLLRKNTLHGELTVQTKNGPRTVVAQRGEVTAVDAAGLTVKSADGFTLTWTFGGKLRVRQDGKAAERTAITTGAQVGVAGAEDGAATVARLVRVG
ncbi:hypothetical protein [Spirilliplanes yamanashiensis]|uniref:FecR protein domain-containing protein n=1 Tax=Spirilliplanes yamanashiensis TaxID=42233 RepID=A0A8J4DLL0_9ACTN|nr:hypothetical protein [Spirilliplanes yamanashiensis]MDP9818900.1 hypothetical protein [Spirilliplanes yamanashiensis]GIJ05354.1 hypothetical protein Sya03_47060 [Spirilliplanes yamanashiensis]